MSTFRARTPNDLLALAPIVLGFTPTDSLVILTFEPDGSAHVRLDLDEVADVLPECIEAGLIGTRIAVIGYSTNPDAAVPATRTALDLLPPAAVAAVLHADGTGWRPWTGDTYGDPAAPYDNTTHPFTLQAHFDGRTIHPSRTALAATLTTDPTAVGAHLDDAYTRLEELLSSNDPDWVAAHQRWAAAKIRDWTTTGTPAPAADLAMLAVLAQFTEILDACHDALDTDHPDTQLSVAVQLAARVPDDLAAPLCCLAAQAALNAGNGTVARLQLDRAALIHPTYPRLAALAARISPAGHPHRTNPAT